MTSPRSGGVTGSSRTSKGASTDESIKPQQDLNYHVRQVKHALTHFKDVICKNKLEMLPGNGTVVLDMISNVHVALQSYTLNENSSSLISATKQVHLSLGKLIKFCDEILLNEEENSASLSKENVKEIVDLVENAVNNLVKLANEKMIEREAGAQNEQNAKTTCNTLQRPAIDVAGQRTSLPDIPLTPRELDTLEKTSMKTVRASHSTESILRDTSPPPKPPLPSNRQSIGSGNSGGGSSQLCSGNDDDMLDDNLIDDRNNPNPPPLPPKRRSNVSSARHNNTNNFSINSADSDCIINDNSFLACGLERMSMRSRSPEDNSSLLSASAGSLDSALNHSREEDELRALTHDHSSIDEQILTNDLDKINSSHVAGINSTNIISASNRWTDESEAGQILTIAGITQSDGLNNRHSNESGFVSMHSLRSSIQSMSTTKRTSQQTKITNISSTTSSSIQKSESILESLSEQQTQITSSSTVKIGQKQVLSSHQEILKQNSEQEMTVHKSTENFSAISKADSFDFNSDDVFDGSFSELGPGDLPPALPVKTRRRSSKRERHLSTYDNVEDTEQNEQNTQDQHLPLRFPSHAQSLLNRHQNSMTSKHQSLIEPRHMKNFDGEQPPPLPIKKKHIMAYMEIFGNCSHSPQSASEFLRHSVHTYNLSHSSEHHQHHHSQQVSHSVISHSQTMSLSPLRNQIQTMQSPPDSPTILDKPPALPPKRVRGNSRTITPPCIITTPPPSPKILNNQSSVQSVVPTIINDHQDQRSPSLNNNDSCHNNNNAKNNSISNNITVSPSSQKKVLNSNQVITISSSSLSSVTGQPNVTKTVVIPAISSISNNTVSSTTTTTTNTIPNNAITYSNNCNNLYDNAKDDDKENYLHLCDTTTIISPNATTQNTTTTTTGTPATNGTQQQNNLNLLTKNNHNLKILNNINDNNNSNHNNNCNNNNNSLDMIDDDDEVEVVLRRNISANKTGDKNGIVPKSPKQQPDTVIPEPNLNLIEEIDVTKYLVIKKEGEDGPDVKGGHPDALIIHATRRSDNAYGEAFITTFRTFISPYELIEKLIHRYNVYSIQIMSNEKQRAAKESFSLLVRVVYDLTTPDLTTQLIDFISDFVYHLVCAGQLVMARLLRVKLLEKALLYKQQKMPAPNATLSSRAVIAQPPTLLDLKPSEIAEQMTLLDAELFEKIEIPEVLIWAQEQCEERSPNLTRFTEHFNKMSYWARSQILKQEDAKDREKYVIKFIKIMKHLRKINNYNSYLALLSALDSAPIRRLDWHNQKQITEGLKEYCALIDSSSSFRAYRQALAETNPPCIPYIGLVLQDLTFVHIGNQNNLSENNINFSKRWQQYNIVVNMKRFKKCSYPYKKNEKIIGFFDNFENYLDEDAMWQISENIKPRGSGKRQVAN